MQNDIIAQQLEDLKAVLVQNKMTLPHLSFVPTRTATFTGDFIAYKIRPLLADEKGCMTIRIVPDHLQTLIDMARCDQNLLVREKTTRLFSRPFIAAYDISLKADTPLTTPCSSPRIALHHLPREPIEERCEPDWMENEGWVGEGELRI